MHNIIGRIRIALLRKRWWTFSELYHVQCLCFFHSNCTSTCALFHFVSTSNRWNACVFARNSLLLLCFLLLFLFLLHKIMSRLFFYLRCHYHIDEWWSFKRLSIDCSAEKWSNKHRTIWTNHKTDTRTNVFNRILSHVSMFAWRLTTCKSEYFNAVWMSMKSSFLSASLSCRSDRFTTWTIVESLSELMLSNSQCHCEVNVPCAEREVSCELNCSTLYSVTCMSQVNEF